MPLRTSLNDPLLIASVLSIDGHGTIGLTICPGKQQDNALSGKFQRDLNLDLDIVKNWGAKAVVTLMSDAELADLQVSQLGEEVETRDMLWFHMPIPDQGMPDDGFEIRWIYAGLRLRQLLRAGNNVLVHCRSGLGRTGLIVSRLLIELGIPVNEAVAKVREARPGTLQHATHERYLRSCEAAENDEWLDRVLGCLLGGAVGDAFGYTVEFDSLASIRQRYGSEGLTKPVFQQGRLVVSDDTQMTLFTLEGILRCTNETGDLVVSEQTILKQITNAYLDWYNTQTGEPDTALNGLLAASPTMRVRRAPGNTCLSALKAGAHGSIEQPINDSKGCGGVMRTAPIGFLQHIKQFEEGERAEAQVDEDIYVAQNLDLFDLGARAAALTHGHADGWAPAGILPRIVSRLINGEEKFLAVRNGFSDASEWGHAYGKVAHTDGYLLARKLAKRMRFNPEEAIRQLGQGWVGDEALAIAMYAFLSGRSFTDTVIRATNHDGDSDSTASIAGQLWGAQHGVMGIPHDWIERLDVLQEILLLARQMQDWQREVSWPTDCLRELPTTEAELFSSSHHLNRLDENPEDYMLDEEGQPLENATANDSSAATVDAEQPEPNDFDFSELDGRTHALVALYHQGESYLLQVTQKLWGILPEPRTETALKLCQLSGIVGEGKVGLHKLLASYLQQADQACDRAAGDSEREWKTEQGGLDWDKVGQTFALMDEALLKTAFGLSKLIEQVINPD